MSIPPQIQTLSLFIKASTAAALDGKMDEEDNADIIDLSSGSDFDTGVFTYKILDICLPHIAWCTWIGEDIMAFLQVDNNETLHKISSRK